MPVHDAADCRAQNCHHHSAPLVPRDLATAADLAAVPIWRYEPPAEECEHPVTVTRRLDVAQPIPGDPDNVRIIGQTTGRVTACLDCHHLAPAPEESPAP